MSTQRAKELLAKATALEPPACQCPRGVAGAHGQPSDDKPCAWFDWMFSQPGAEQELREQAPDTLAAAIALAEAFRAHTHQPSSDGHCLGCQALAAFDALFPEEAGG